MSYWGKYYCHYRVLKVLKTAKSLQSFCGKSFRNVMHSPYKSKTVSQTTLLLIQTFFFSNVFQQQTRRVCDKQTGQANHNETQNNFFQPLYFCFILQELIKEKEETVSSPNSMIIFYKICRSALTEKGVGQLQWTTLLIHL